MASLILPAMFHKTNSIDVNLRHGTVLAIGEIVLSLSELQALDGNTKFLDEPLLQLINGLITQFYNRGQYRGLFVFAFSFYSLMKFPNLFLGMSGEMMSQCSCDFIRNCSIAKVKATNECIGK